MSFVAGLMLGVGVLHMLPHAIADATIGQGGDADPRGDHDDVVDAWRHPGDVFHRAILLLPPSRRAGRRTGHTHDHVGCDHASSRPQRAHHDVSWSGAALGLFLHSVLNGVALAASVANSHGDTRLAGLGTFLVIFLHKPFDAMTIGMLMARGG